MLGEDHAFEGEEPEPQGPIRQPHQLSPCKAGGCDVETNSRSGFCKKHKKEFKSTTEGHVLRCEECPERVAEVCDYAGHTESGLCFYEVTRSSDDFNDREQIATEFRHMLHVSRTMIGRIERAIVGNIASETNQNLVRELRMQQQAFASHQQAFNRFMGWDRKIAGREDKKDRMGALGKMVGYNNIEYKNAQKKGQLDKKKEVKPIVIDDRVVAKPKGSNPVLEIATEESDALPREEFHTIQDDTIQDDLAELEELKAEGHAKEIELFEQEQDNEGGENDKGRSSTKRKVSRL